MTRTRPGLQWSDGAAGPVIAGLASDEAQSWRDYAACAETDPEIFYPEKGESNHAAKKVCAGCFVREQCLAYAVDNVETFGVWGGLSEQQRRKLRPSGHMPAPVAVTEKTCTSCHETKSADEFWRNRVKPDGLANWCIACHIEREPRRRRKVAA